MSKTFIDQTDIAVDGPCYIYRRKPGGVWQYCLGIPMSEARNGTNEIRKTCKTKNIDRARIVAIEAFRGLQNKLLMKKSVHSDAFKNVAKNLLSIMTLNGEKSKLKDYKKIIDNHLIPFFGEELITEIKDIDVKQYWSWRVEKRKKQMEDGFLKHELRVLREEAKYKRTEVKRMRELGDDYISYEFVPPIYKPRFKNLVFPASTILSENSVLKSVFLLAVDEEYMSENEMPRIALPKKNASYSKIKISRESEVKAVFTKAEVKALKLYSIKRFETRKDKFLSFINKLPEEKLIARGFASASGFKKSNSFVWPKNSKVWSAYRLMIMLHLFTHTGMRPSTLTRLKVKDVFKISGDNNQFKNSVAEKIYDEADQFSKQLFREKLAKLKSEDGVKYAFRGRTKKGKHGVERVGLIVPDYQISELISEYLKYFSTKHPDDFLFPILGASINQAFKRMFEEDDSDLQLEMLFDLDGNEKSVYSLRHYYITEKVLEGLSFSHIASNCLTSTKVVEDFYNHFKPTDNYDELSGFKKK